MFVAAHPGWHPTLIASTPASDRRRWSFVYDNLSRKTQRYGVQNAQTVDSETYAYDKLSSLTSAVSGSITSTIGYDNAERLLSVTQGTASTSYVYSPTNDRLTSRTDPAGTTSVGYDAYSRLNSITTPFSATAVGYTFDAAGRQLTRTDPSGLTTTRGYDTPYTGRLLSETVTGASSASFSYTYDAVSNVKTASQTMPSTPTTGPGHTATTTRTAQRAPS